MIIGERIVIIMSWTMKILGGVIVTGWVAYLSTLVALTSAGVSLDRGPLHAGLVTIGAVTTLAWIIAATGRWLRAELLRAWRLDGRPADHVAGGPAAEYLNDAAEIYDLGRRAGER